MAFVAVVGRESVCKEAVPFTRSFIGSTPNISSLITGPGSILCVCVVVFIADPYPKAKGVIESKHSVLFVSPSSGRLFPVPFYVCYSLFHLLSMRFVRVVWAMNVGIPFPGKARDKPSGPLSAVYKEDTFLPPNPVRRVDKLLCSLAAA